MPTSLKSWTEIRASGPEAGRDEAIAILVGAGSGAVIESVRSVGDASDEKQAQALTASLPLGATEELSVLRVGLKAIGWAITLSTIKERDWSHAWRHGMRPIRLSVPRGIEGSGLLIHTSWSRAIKKFGEAEVIIDPSMAFGTGTHSTTKMCLKALVRLHCCDDGARAGGSILDVGTGTGILMIASMKLGADKALGLEIDPVAMSVARANIRTNGVKARLSNLPLPKIDEKFSIITANLFCEELRRLGPELVDRLDSKQGYMVLSGILREQAPVVVSSYRGLGMRVFKKLVEGEWACLVLCRSAGKGGL